MEPKAVRVREVVALCIAVACAISEILADPPPTACEGTEIVQFEVQASADGESTWSSSSLTIYAYPSTQIDVAVRTRMTVIAGQTQGWSFSMEHDPSWLQFYSGNLTLNAVTTDGTDTDTVKNGGPPDMDETHTRAGFNGYTQGVVIDNSSQVTLGPTLNFVSSKACYRIDVPPYEGSYQATFKFNHELGDPRVRSVVTQGGQSNIPCANNVTLRIEVSYYCYGCSLSACTIESGSESKSAGAAMGPMAPLPAGSAGSDFRRGDSNDDGSVNISDPIHIFNFLFQGGIGSGCLDAADGNDDENVDISDGIYVLSYLFSAGPPPPEPGPTVCGPDLTDQVVLQLDCQRYDNCDQSDDDGDELTNNYESQIATDANFGDTDGDGFLDGQEVLPTGVPGCGGAINISKSASGFGPSNGADPLQRDVFVEVDWMTAADHDHKPLNEALTRVSQAFQAQGITLHIDTGESGTPFNLGNESNVIGDETFLADVCEIQAVFNRVEEIKADPDQFDPSRCNVFHYGLLVHQLAPDCPTTSGTSQGIFTDDFVVSLGADGFGFLPPITLQGATFMHELGHTLSLRHGGFEDTNGKPNYRSVMNWVQMFLSRAFSSSYESRGNWGGFARQ